MRPVRLAARAQWAAPSLLMLLCAIGCADPNTDAPTRDAAADLPNSPSLDAPPDLPAADATPDLDAPDVPSDAPTDQGDMMTAPDADMGDDGPCRDVPLQAQLTQVQPMTGVVLWESSWNNHALKTQPGNIQLEYAYVTPGSLSTGPGTYDWAALEARLDRIAARGHQAILRFHYVWPGRATGVPDWIKARADYQETSGMSEGQLTWFVDWSSQALRDFHLDFFEAFAARYDDDPRLAFLQVGFGLWAEYHIYEGPRELGAQFPSHAFQASFVRHLEQQLDALAWSVSIDAGSSYYAPFSADAALRDVAFGLFDDSFMHEAHGGYNTTMWEVFDYTRRYERAPHGGELSYYTEEDQARALDVGGLHGRTFEAQAAKFHLSYMIGDGQPNHQSVARIKEAAMAMGYRLRITKLQLCGARAEVEVTNEGVAPPYFDAWVSLDGVRAQGSLKGLLPGATRSFTVAVSAAAPTLTIEADRLVPGQRIEFNADLP